MKQTEADGPAEQPGLGWRPDNRADGHRVVRGRRACMVVWM